MSSDRPVRPWLWIGGSLVLLALYVLSIGPIAWLDSNIGIPEPVRTALDAFYSPLGWLVEKSPAFGRVMMSYLDWWR